MKRFIRVVAISLLIGTCLALASCESAETGDYSIESVTGVVKADSETYAQLYDMLGMLTVDSIVIPEFDNMKDAIGLFRDSVLNYMLGKNYARYAGNAKLIAKITEKHPDIDVIAAIPANELESIVYRNFGGSVKIVHESGKLFKYLKSADAYIPVTAPVNGGVDIRLTEILETENTYRLRFCCSADEKKLEYFALAVKRDDGSCYFDALLHE